MNNKLKNKIIQFLNSEYRDLKQFKIEIYPNHVFFMKNGKAIFDYNLENGYVNISHDKIWSFLESFFGLNYKEIQDLTKEWVEEHYKLRVTTTFGRVGIPEVMVEEHYKLRVTTTQNVSRTRLRQVEERYRLKTYERESQTFYL